MNISENAEFTDLLKGAVAEAEKLGYRPNRFKSMLDADGGFETVKRILASGKPSEGFQRLWELGRLELTCEAIIVETKWRLFFDQDLLVLAERRLHQSNYRYEPFQRAPEKKEDPPVQIGWETDDFVPPVEDERVRAKRNVAVRPWQGKFREALFERYGVACCITGCVVPEALEAAHISAYLGSRSDDARNGLILRSDLHALFDCHLFSVHPDELTVTLSVALRQDSTYCTLQGTKLFEASSCRPSRNVLQEHWLKFLELNIGCPA